MSNLRALLEKQLSNAGGEGGDRTSIVEEVIHDYITPRVLNRFSPVFFSILFNLSSTLRANVIRV
jgi:hypothetical protein